LAPLCSFSQASQQQQQVMAGRLALPTVGGDAATLLDPEVEVEEVPGTKRIGGSAVVATAATGLAAFAGCALVVALATLYPTVPGSSDTTQAEKLSIIGLEEIGDCAPSPDCTEYPEPIASGKWPSNYKLSGSFPKGFIWGFGTAAYQVEGAYNESGRGASIWDTFSGADTKGMPGGDCSYCCKTAICPINDGVGSEARGSTGNVACDVYHTWRSDIALMKSMGLKHYRFSIAWPRVVPTGKIADGVNQNALKWYDNFINALIEAGITPYVTLYHWDLPQALLSPPEEEGWYSTDKATGHPDGKVVQHFVDYADLCFKAFGDRVKTWVTFNEAWTFTFLASGFGKAPGVEPYMNMTIHPWIAGHNVLLAHAEVVHLYRNEYSHQNGEIGITNNCDWREPKTDDPKDIAAAERAVLFQLGWFSDPIYGGEGDYPPEMKHVYGEYLPNFTAEQKEKLKGSADFYGFNHYGTAWAAHSEEPGADRSYANVTEEGFPKAQSKWLFGSGWGFRKLLNWISRRYNRPKIYVTEGGWSLEAQTAEDGVDDLPRVQYYANYTSSMLDAINEDNVDVKAYFAWSLMDNYEWERGYIERFGATFVDFDFGYDEFAPADSENQPTSGAQTRQRKMSGCWLEAVWTGNALVDYQSEDFEGCVDSSVFNRVISDPNRSGCLWNITVDDTGKNGTITGNTMCPGPGNGFVITASFGGGSVIADFSAVGGASRLAGYWNRAGKGSIEWGDGSTWTASGGIRAGMRASVALACLAVLLLLM